MRRSLTAGFSLDPRTIYHNAKPTDLWVWDGVNHNERRRALFPGYKIRDYTGQENIFAGLDFYRALLSHSPAVQVEADGWEADDVCFTLAKRLGVPVTIHTNDFDFWQLADDPLIKLSGVKPPIEGIRPRHVRLYKALIGDPSDRIPGIPGFGKKTWASWADLWDRAAAYLDARDIAAFRTLPAPPRVKAWLADDANMELILIYYQITEMLEVPADDIKPTVGFPNHAAADALFRKFML